MNVISDHSDYLQRRLSGESVISIASMFGIGALKQVPVLKDFDVLSLYRDVYSVYSYQAENGKFCVTDMHESLSHALEEKLPSALLMDQNTMRWWNCVFFEQDGKRRYDAAYDDLIVSEGNTLCFKDVINSARQELSQLLISKQATHIFLAGDLATNPLIQYILQVLFPTKRISTLHQEQNKDIEEHLFVIPNKRLEKMSLRTNQIITLSSLASQPIHITIPLDSSMDSIMLPDLKWKDMLTDEQKDYSVNNLDFKKIQLRVDYDVFSNIFVTSEDMHGHRKVVQIN